MTRNPKYILLIILLCLIYMNTSACSCGYIKEISAEALMFDGIVFRGKVIDMQTNYATFEGDTWATDKIATFVVEKWYSHQEVSDTVVVNTGGGGGDCGLFFNKGETWLIYAYNDHGIIESSSCTQSIESKNDSYATSVKRLEKLKSKTGHVKEKLLWANEPYVLSGKIRNGKPVGKWVRIRNKDSIAVVNFNNKGNRHGYQMEKHFDWNDIAEKNYEMTEQYYETTDTDFKVYNSSKELILFYEVMRGRRNGKYEYKSYGRFTYIVNANYRNGRLVGTWTSWHEDGAIAEGLIKTIKVFDKDRLKSSTRYDEATGKEIK